MEILMKDSNALKICWKWEKRRGWTFLLLGSNEIQICWEWEKGRGWTFYCQAAMKYRSVGSGRKGEDGHFIVGQQRITDLLGVGEEDGHFTVGQQCY